MVAARRPCVVRPAAFAVVLRGSLGSVQLCSCCQAAGRAPRAAWDARGARRPHGRAPKSARRPRRTAIEQLVDVVGKMDFGGEIPPHIEGAEYWVHWEASKKVGDSTAAGGLTGAHASGHLDEPRSPGLLRC